MSLFDRIRSLFEDEEEPRYESGPEPSNLFDLSGAALTMEDTLGYEPTGHAALCFSAPDDEDFDVTLEDLKAVLEASEADEGIRSRFTEDDHGYRWVVLEDDSVEDLVTNLQFAAETFVDRHYDEHLLAALLSFRRDERRAYWIYVFDRGTFYPFVPEPDEDRERDTPTEFRLQSVLEDDLEIEPDETHWYPLWPDRPGNHPWD